jgi:UDP-2,4-diacetamido-2,4,6-trideoxy-beta-L-altropyranose hydrolase
MDNPVVFLRADGNSEIGLGHISRMIALAGVLTKYFHCVFLVKSPNHLVASILSANNFTLRALETEHVTGIKSDDILVLDGYQFDWEYQKAVKETIGCKLVCINDVPGGRFASELVINHSGGLTPVDFKVSRSTKLLLGPGFALLRNSFYQVAAHGENNRSHSIEAKHLFLNFGGADPDNYTCRIIEEILTHGPSFSKISVVVGGAYAHADALEDIVANRSNITVIRNVDAEELISIMSTAAYAICSSSTIAYEYCSVGGLLFVVRTAENQRRLYDFLIGEKLALDYANFAEIMTTAQDDNLRMQLIGNQKRYFDGNAGIRLSKSFFQLGLLHLISVREAKKEDVDIYFQWANDQEVRNNSFNTSPIPYDAHIIWFEKQLESKENKTYVLALPNGRLVASVRFKLDNKKAILSYLIDQEFRNMGLSSTVLTKGSETLFRSCPFINTIEGFVKRVNIASVKAFKSSGFEEVGTDQPDIRCFLKRSL